MKWLGFINKRLREQSNTNEAMLEYYRIFEKKKAITTWVSIIRFLSPTRGTQKSALLFLAVGTGIGTYALCKYLK